MPNTVPIRGGKEQPPLLKLKEAIFSDGRYLGNVELRIGERIAGDRDDLANVFEARLDHPEAEDFPEIVCKIIRRESAVDGLGWRENRVYEVIRNRPDKGSYLHLAHLVARDSTNDFYYFVLERYGDDAYKLANRASSSEERARLAERFFVSGYLALSELAGFGLAMRDVQPQNFLCRPLAKGEVSNPYGPEHEIDYDFVAVDFGHAYIGPPTTEGGLQGMAHVQHPDLLGRKKVRHRGFIDDVFSLAVVAHIMLTEDQYLPWVMRGDGSRIPFVGYDVDEFQDLFRENALKFSPALPVEGAHRTFLTILENLLRIEPSEEERQDYADNELLPLTVEFAPWAKESLERAEATRIGLRSNGQENPAAYVQPEQLNMVPTEPHGIPYLAELSDFRPQPKLRSEREPVLTRNLSRSISSRARALLRESIPFIVAASSIPAVYLAASGLGSVLPSKWLSICQVLAWISAAIDIGIIGVQRNWDGPAKSVRGALIRGIVPVALVFVALIAIPTALVAGIQTALIYVPAVSWRFEDWSWPQWLLFVTPLVAAVLFVLAWTWASRKKMLRWTAGILALAAVTPTLVAAAPPLEPRPEITPNCGQSTIALSTATANLCIPTIKNWTVLSKEDYAKDPFVASMRFPAYVSAGAGPGGAAAVLKSTQFPCLSVYVESQDGSPSSLSFNNELFVADDVNNPQAKPVPVSNTGADGNVTRIRLGSQSYIVYPHTQESPESGTVTGTTTYAALAGGQLFGQPDDYSSGTYPTFVFAVQRACPAADQEKVRGAVQALIGSVKLNERGRLDPMDMQYDARALLERGIAPENIDIPLVDGVTSTSWPSPLSVITDKTSLASGAVWVTRAQDGPWMQIDFLDHKPDGFDTATATSPVDGWAATENHSATDTKSGVTTTARSFFQKQTVGGKDYYVAATLLIRDTSAYDPAAAERVRALVAGIHLSNPKISYVVGATS